MSSEAWVPLLTEIVQTELAERDRAERLAELVNRIRSLNVPILSVVKALGAYLTTGDDGQRARATGALAEVVEAAPAAAAGSGEVQHLVDFFTSRLTDWPAVRGALKGCLALLSRRGAASGQAATGPAPQQQQQQQGGLAEVEDGAAVALVRTAVSHVFIRALAQPDRALALRLLLAAMEGYGGAVLRAGLDLLEYLISSVDGEKDPRCLLLCFQAVRALLRLYHAQPETSLCHDRLEEGAEELFEVLACYFPITFTPPPNDPNRITRQDLAAGLEAALAAEPLFAPHVVPLACEKLSSTLRQAKLDALSLLAACAEGYGPAPLSEHVATLWAALRSELATPAAEGLLPADRPAAEELAAAAATCLARCAAAFQAGGGGGEPAVGARLAEAVLQDEGVRDMLPCIQSPGADPAVHRRSVLRAQAAARAAGALCRAGGHAAARAMSQLVPPLLAAAGQAQAALGWQSLCLAWSALQGLLATATAAQALPGAAALPLDAALLQQVVDAAAAGLASVAAEAADADGGEGGEGGEEPGEADCVAWPLLQQDCTQRRAAALQLSTLAAVLGDAAMAGAVSRPAVETALQSVIQLLLAPLDGPGPLGTLAVAALAAPAGGCHAAALVDVALPRLLAAAQQPRTAAAALAALRALAAASGALQLEIVVLLDQPIQQLLPAAAAASQTGDGGDSRQQVLRQLLAAAGDVVSARQPAGGEASNAASFLQLGQHLFDAAQLLPAGGTAAGTELQGACAELAYRAALPAPAAQQQPLAAAAAAQLAREAPLGSLPAAVACALLASLRPQAVRGLAGEVPLPELVRRLVGLAVEQATEAAAARWAAAAAAALLNKWPLDDDDALAACVEPLQGQLAEACGLAAGGGSALAPHPSAWACQAATTRALAMRGSRAADAAIGHVVTALHAAAQGWRAESGAPGGCAAGVMAAATFLGAVLEGGSDRGSPGLTAEAHAVAKPLWQQRIYTAAAGQLLPLLQASEQAAAGAAGVGGHRQPAASPVLLLALGHLLRAAPDRVWQQEQQRMLPWLLRCLAALQQGPVAGPDLLLPLLLLLSNALASAAGKQQAEGELLPSLVPVLLELAAYRPSAAVRETALRCLLLLAELPYTCLHPYRRQVARALAAAVDDGRRAVRLAAARCRQAWSAF